MKIRKMKKLMILFWLFSVGIIVYGQEQDNESNLKSFTVKLWTDSIPGAINCPCPAKVLP